MDELLKGNFKVKHKIEIDEQEKTLSSSEKIAQDLRKTALEALGGSMVYVERTHLSWDGDSKKKG